jgi:hypothetical protein
MDRQPKKPRHDYCHKNRNPPDGRRRGGLENGGRGDANAKAAAPTLEDLMKMDLVERLAAFDALTESERLILLYPPMRITGLPDRDPLPDNWEGMIAQASAKVKTKIQSYFPKTQASASATSAALSECSDSDEEDSDEEGGFYGKDVVHAMTQGNRSSSTTNNNQLVSEAEKNQLRFLENLPRCLPIMTYGFHVPRLKRGTKDDFCFCPCDRSTPQGTVAGRWRKLCGMDGILSQSIDKSKKLIQMEPKPFLDHLRSKASCVYHRTVFDFLDELYSEFNGLQERHAKHNKHISFFDVHSKDWKEIERCIQKKEENIAKLAAEKMMWDERRLRELEEDKHQLVQASLGDGHCVHDDRRAHRLTNACVYP